MRKLKTRTERPSCVFQNRGSELEIIHGAHSIPQHPPPQPNKTLRNHWCSPIHPFPLLPPVSPLPPPSSARTLLSLYFPSKVAMPPACQNDKMAQSPCSQSDSLACTGELGQPSHILTSFICSSEKFWIHTNA